MVAIVKYAADSISSFADLGFWGFGVLQFYRERRPFHTGGSSFTARGPKRPHLHWGLRGACESLAF